MIYIRRRSRRLPFLLFIASIFLYLWQFGVPNFRSRYIYYNGIPFRKSGFDWASLSLQHPIEKLSFPPAGAPIDFPRVQHVFKNEDKAPNELAESRRMAVLNAFRRSWNSYKKHAWMFDELVPVGGGGRNTFGGWAATMVDALDTLWIMGLHDEFHEAVRAVSLIDWSNTTETSVNMFETTIRHLGGLLSAYDLSQEPALLAKAVELGDMLYMGFDTPNRMPPFWLDFKRAKSGSQSAQDRASSAAGASLSMEFTRLSQLTGMPKYYDATERVKKFLLQTQNQTKLPGMWPMYINYRREIADDNSFTLGAQADSLYEYLPKMHALLGGLDPDYLNMTVWSLDVAKENLLFRPMTPDKQDIIFAGNVIARATGVELSPESQHLGCFVGGMYALAGKLLSKPDYVSIGEQAARGCAWAYKSFPTGIMPEIISLIPCKTPNLGPCEWDEKEWSTSGNSNYAKGFKAVRDFRYLLRPEAIESIFYMYRISGNEEYREIAWTMFEGILKATETDLAYSAISNVNTKGETVKLDSTESFWFSETLKYFYLIFSSPDVINLDDWVFNTEAHPFKRPKAGGKMGMEQNSKHVVISEQKL